MKTLYVVVYGPEWEDIMYFTCVEKAKIKLVLQSTLSNNNPSFVPTMYEYNENDEGVYGQTKTHLQVSLEAFEQLGLNAEDIKRDPRLVFPALVIH